MRQLDTDLSPLQAHWALCLARVRPDVMQQVVRLEAMASRMDLEALSRTPAWAALCAVAHNQPPPWHWRARFYAGFALGLALRRWPVLLRPVQWWYRRVLTPPLERARVRSRYGYHQN